MEIKEIAGGLALVILIFIGITGYNYMETRNDKEMAVSGLEQCPQTPDWSNSGSIWVKNCDKYMKSWKSAQDD